MGGILAVRRQNGPGTTIGSPDNCVGYGKQGSVALCRDRKSQSYCEPILISRPVLHQHLRFGVLGAH
jgi:hypothetical protein